MYEESFPIRPILILCLPAHNKQRVRQIERDCHWECVEVSVESVVCPLSTFKLYLRAVFLLKLLYLSLSPPMLKHTHSWLVYLCPLPLPSDWVTDGKWWQTWQVQTRSWTPVWQIKQQRTEIRTQKRGCCFIDTSHRCLTEWVWFLLRFVIMKDAIL